MEAIVRARSLTQNYRQCLITLRRVRKIPSHQIIFLFLPFLLIPRNVGGFVHRQVALVVQQRTRSILQQTIHQQFDATDVDLLFGVEIHVAFPVAVVQHFRQGQRKGRK